MKFFDNITWPNRAVFNVTGNAGKTCGGGADIEHIYIEEGKKNVWVQKRNERIMKQIMDYAEYAETRVCNS